MATSDILNALSSSSGAGQGIDVTSTVNQLIANLRSPEQVWQTQQKLLQTQVSSLTQLNKEVTDLSTAVDNLRDAAGNLMARSVTSSQPGLVTATASNATPIGSHTVVVNSLAPLLRPILIPWLQAPPPWGPGLSPSKSVPRPL